MQHLLACHEIVKTDFVRGENCYLYDAQGKRYTDLESGIWSAALGHNHPRINQVIHAQLEQIMHLGTRYPHALAEMTAVEVLRLVGINEGKCVFLSSGSEAVEFGVQIARRVTGRPLLLTLAESYLAAYGSAGSKRADEWLLLEWSAGAPTDAHEYLQNIPFEKIGAFIFEPGGSGSAFVKFPPKPLVQAIVERVKQAGGLLMTNEITTGMGRTGRWFGFQHYDIQPDIVALGKGLGNGYPVSAVALRQDLAENLEAGGFHYAQSHQNDPLGCAVANQVVTVLREENLIERGNSVGGTFLEQLRQLGEKHALVKEARGRGMLLGVELHPHANFSVSAAYRALLDKGYIVGYYPAGNVLRLSPALTAQAEDLTRFVECLDELLANAG
ncbi:MAG: Acetylornithine aminotransferase [Anaerolineae bacterium]|nr:Acetylornithine aminotransferase [Anaerolineae bacterium]